MEENSLKIFFQQATCSHPAESPAAGVYGVEDGGEGGAGEEAEAVLAPGLGVVLVLAGGGVAGVAAIAGVAGVLVPGPHQPRAQGDQHREGGGGHQHQEH